MVTDAQRETQQRVGVWKLVLFLEVFVIRGYKKYKSNIDKKEKCNLRTFNRLLYQNAVAIWPVTGQGIQNTK